jgi:hypothetical protein
MGLSYCSIVLGFLGLGFCGVPLFEMGIWSLCVDVMLASVNCFDVVAPAGAIHPFNLVAFFSY